MSAKVTPSDTDPNMIDSRVSNDIELGNAGKTGFHKVRGTTSKPAHNVLQFDVSFTVKVKKETRTIVNRVSDVVSSGESLAIMGPSGAGKTSLLKVLTLAAFGGESYGELLLNGIAMTAERFSRRCAIVEQEDHHWALLTCRETLAYAADLYMNAPRHEKAAAAAAMLEKMGLESCADTIVGNLFIKGLSGGQKRRLSLGVALLKNVDVVFLDEVTSGLDAASAAGIMSFITEVTKSEQLITVFTIHQPSTQIYNSFDRILLLSEGKTAFCGPKSQVLPYFQSIKLPVPEQTNPAEYMLDLVNKDFSDKERVSAVLEHWESSGATNHAQHVAEVIAAAHFDNQSARVSDYSAGLLSQIVTMFRRHFTLALRDPTLFTGRIVMFLLTTVFFAIIYIEARDRNQEQALQRLWYLVWIVGVPTSMGVGGVFAYNTEYHAIKREVKNGMVSPLSYMLATAVMHIPVMFIFAAASISVGAYGILDYVGSRYGEVMLIYACTMFGFESIAQLLAVSFENPLLGMLQYIQCWFAAFLFSGLFVDVDDIIWPFRAFSFVFPLKYGLRSMAYQEFIARDFRGAELCDPKPDDDGECNFVSGRRGSDEGWVCNDLDSDEVCYGKKGWQVLSSIGETFDTFGDDDRTVTDVIILLGIAVAAKTLYMIMMYAKANKASRIEPPAKNTHVSPPASVTDD